MHPFWFFFAVLLACIAAYFVCGMHIKSRRADTNFNPLHRTIRPVQGEGNTCARQGQTARPR